MKRILGILIAVAMVSVAFAGIAAAGESIFVLGTTGTDGAAVTGWVPQRSNEICTDETGANGNSGTPGMWAYDGGNYFTGWVSPCPTRTMICTAAGGTVVIDGTMITGAGVLDLTGTPITPVAMSIPTATVDVPNLEVDLTWVNPGVPALWGYLVYRSNDGGAGYNIIGGSVSNLATGRWWSAPITVERADTVVAATSFSDTTGVAGEDYAYAIRYVYAGQIGGVNWGVPTMIHDGQLGQPTVYTPVYSGYSNLVTFPGGSFNTPPTVDAADTTDHFGDTNNEYVTLTATGSDVDGDPVTLQYSWDAGAWTTFTSPVNLNFPDPYTEGPHTVVVRAYDGTDYSLVNLNADFTVTDTTDPLAGWGTVPGASMYVNQALTFTASFEDFSDYETALAGSYFTYSVNAVPAGNFAWTPTFDGYGSYLYTLTYSIPASTFVAGDVITYGGQVTDTAATPGTTVLGAGGPITMNDPPEFVEPFPVYGFVYLYDGTGGVYTPLIAPAGTPVQVEYYDGVLTANRIINDVTIAGGQFSIDIMNALDADPYGIEIRAGPFPGYGNMGYNWTAIVASQTAGGVWVDVICGVPYNVTITAPPPLSIVTSALPFPITYTITDIDGVPCAGYFSFFDGPMTWTSGDLLATLPVAYTIDGTAGGFTGTQIDALTLVTGGLQWVNISERIFPADCNWYPSIFGAFQLRMGGVLVDGWYDDWDNITLLVLAGGFDWNLVQGWNLVSCPQDAVYRALGSVNLFFDAQDALTCVNEYLLTNFGVTDPLLSLSDRIGVGAYQTYDVGQPEPAWGLDTTSGYWVYYSLAVPHIVHFIANNATCNAGTHYVDVAVGANWNLLGYQHNYTGNTGWAYYPFAADFTNGVIATYLWHVDLGGARTKIVVTEWLELALPQWYNSYVVDIGFPGMATKNWQWDGTYSANPGNGYWLWVDVGGTITYDVEL